MSSASPPSQSASASVDTSNTSALERARGLFVDATGGRTRARAHLTALTRHVAARAADVSLAERSLGCVPLSREALRSLALRAPCRACQPGARGPSRGADKTKTKKKRGGRSAAGPALALPPQSSHTHLPPPATPRHPPVGPSSVPSESSPAPRTPPHPARPPAAGGSARRAPCGATGTPPSRARAPRAKAVSRLARRPPLRYRPACARARADAAAPRHASPSPYRFLGAAQPAPRDPLSLSPARAAAPPRVPMGA